MPVVVVYATGSRTIRRVIVSDAKDASAVRVVAGEDFMEVPFEEYSTANAEGLHAYVASVIGPPLHDTRCVEVDKVGKVVAVYAADPDIDKPLRDKDFTLERHPFAEVGDEKKSGAFERKPPPPPGTKRPPVYIAPPEEEVK